ncbi:MFS transporter [Paenibacillus sp. J5C_2022]|uniref:MFS transporter n=1 Tax=Paenibacillus sp. J5C2022 TaxID=2977129 RepID=UPI0021D171BA|nr:MFS transporter [Paenibacillus sp. J5C2022]MCU6712856.1 MFS transporter [Paenibacillus sp. J5C2022]
MKRPAAIGWALPLLTGLSMLVTGMMESMKGFLPDFFLNEYQFDAQTSGLIFAFSSAGLLGANVLAGRVTALWGWQKAFSRHQVIFTASMALMALLSASSAAVWCGLFLMAGYANGIVGMICNVVLPLASPERAGQLLGRLHFMMGCGFMIGPLVLELIVSGGKSTAEAAAAWPLILFAFAVFGALLAYAGIRPIWPSGDGASKEKRLVEAAKPQRLFSRGSIVPLLGFGLLYFCYVGAEVGLTVWYRPLLIQHYHIEPGIATLLFSVAFGGFTVMRLGVSRSVRRWGYSGTLIRCAALAALSLLGASLVPGLPGALGYAAFLMAIAMIFPTLTALAVSYWGELAASRMGLFFACGFAGGACSTWLIGALQQSASFSHAIMVVTGLFLAFTAVLFGVLRIPFRPIDRRVS